MLLHRFFTKQPSELKLVYYLPVDVLLCIDTNHSVQSYVHACLETTNIIIIIMSALK